MCVRFVIYHKTGWVISLEAGSDWNGPCLRVSGRDNSVTGPVSLAQLDKRPVAPRRAPNYRPGRNNTAIHSDFTIRVGIYFPFRQN